MKGRYTLFDTSHLPVEKELFLTKEVLFFLNMSKHDDMVYHHPNANPTVNNALTFIIRYPAYIFLTGSQYVFLGHFKKLKNFSNIFEY